ncbi:MAG: S-methyl-5-thioribose-1-phosphate isomerase [Burkholderiales bacterium]|nr:S-methyl-5-thioribose-1-phosphate isomerase [Burkholderiales bacterium]
MTAFHTLRWVDDSLELLDQRLLPARLEYPRFTNAEAVAGAIRDLVVRGAPAIGCAAAYGIAVEARRLRGQSTGQFDAGLKQAFDVLGASRPTAVNLQWALDRMRRQLDGSAGLDNSARANVLLIAARTIADEDVRINRAMGTHGAALLPDVCCVMTHCNAGALATAGHGTALGIIRSATSAGKKIEVIVNETRPFLQGARLTAWELQQDGIPVTLIADSAAGHLMGQRSIDAVIVGADRVAANGDVANKIGTYMMAVLARRHGIPFYVACPLSTIDPDTPDGRAIPIEERSTGEVAGYGGMRWAPQDIRICNPVFDVTPAELVTALITERGVLDSPSPAGIRELLGR